MSKKEERMRLDRLLANLGYGSRREVRKLLAQGRVTLGGAPLLDPELRVALNAELSRSLLIDGEALDPLPGLVVMMHKPIGLSCARKDPGSVVYELLPERLQRREPAMSTIGRLDKDTSGLLLFTDDGDLLHRVTSPKKTIAKRYLVGLARPMNGTEAALFASGTLMLHGEEKTLLPANLEVLSPTSATLTIHEGRYHQVRRMFAATGNHVESLHRESIGGLHLPCSLAEGECRALSKDELESIFSQ